ncbi:hypothetical protein ACG04R_16220 [Roseateles sp. BYS78W]|uniref:Uncharacterized protein n=1 Tax=Pelomonas candidula TaxID=3299025 RepID=A0ABW7HE86_9BURK
MAISSSPFGPVTLTGDEAKAFSRAMLLGRGTKAAAEAAANGRRMVADFARNGTVAIELKPKATIPASTSRASSRSTRRGMR